MSGRLTQLLLDSNRLAQYSVQVRCLVCGGENCFDAKRCRQCFAPMAISHQANAKRKSQPPHFLAALGGPGSGKTVFLGMMLDMLSRRSGKLNLLTRSAFSVDAQREVIQGLQSCQFPDPTPDDPPAWSWLHCSAANPDGKPVEFVIPDFSGHSISQELECPCSKPIVRAFLTRCSGSLLFVDASRLALGDAEPDYDAMKAVAYLGELRFPNKKSWGGRPVAIVLTKADQISESADPAEFAAQKAPGLARHCQQQLPRHAFFFASVAGQIANDGLTPVPLRIEPRGIEAPMLWLLSQL